MKIGQLFQPGGIGSLVLKNRIIKSPQSTALGNQDGTVSQRTVNHYKRLAEGGVGLIMTEYTYIDDDASKAIHNQLGISRREHIAGLGWLVDEVHAAGAKIGIQLAHGGRQKFLATAPIKAASDVSWDYVESQYGVRPTPMSVDEINGVVQSFADAAVRAVQARFDLVEIHAGHGYLITNFLSPHTNKRIDNYGGSFANRSRLLLEIVAAVRTSIPRHVPLSIRLSVVDYESDGITIEETIELCAKLQQAGVDVIHASGGHHAGMEYEVSPWFMPRALHRWGWERIKQAVSIPVIASGSLVSPEVAAEIIHSGSADFVSLGRAMLADPDWARKAAQGRLEDITPCIRCNDGCLHRGLNQGRSAGCTVNPSMGEEYRFTVAKADAPKRVAVVGGGPAGLRAAAVLAERGHEVALFEPNELGGKLRVAARSPKKEDALALLLHLVHRVKQYSSITLHSVQATAESLANGGFEHVVLATGAVPYVPHWAQQAPINVIHAIEIDSADQLEGPVVVVGGGLTGCETALWLGQSGRRDVTLVEGKAQLLPRDEIFTDVAMFPKLLEQAGVSYQCSCEVTRVDASGVSCAHADGHSVYIPAQTVVIATGYTPDSALLEALHTAVPTLAVSRVGTADGGSRLMDALHSSFFEARLI